MTTNGLKENKRKTKSTQTRDEKISLTFDVRAIFLLWQSCFSLQLPSNDVCTTNLLYEIYTKNIFLYEYYRYFFHSQFVLLYLLNGSSPYSEQIIFPLLLLLFIPSKNSRVKFWFCESFNWGISSFLRIKKTKKIKER